MANQRRERQELVKQQMSLKKTLASAAKNDKKKIKAQMEELERAMNKKHQDQIADLEAAVSLESVSLGESSNAPPGIIDSTVDTDDVPSNNIPPSIYSTSGGGKGPSRQQKRKAKKAQEERAFREEAEAEAALMPDLKKQEQDAIDLLLAPEKLCIKQVSYIGTVFPS